jgi:hypothetical protein
MMKPLWFLPVFAVVACGGGSDDDSNGGSRPATNATCKATLSGALSATQDCLIFWHQIPSNMDPKPYIGISAWPNPVYGMSFNIFDQEPRIGTYKNGGALKTLGLVHDTAMPVAGSPPKVWHISDNLGAQPNVGRYTVNVTGISDVGMRANVHFWEIDGSLDAVYVADESTGAAGEVTLRLEF